MGPNMNEIISQLQLQETKLAEQLDKAENHSNTLRLQLNQIRGALNALTSKVPSLPTSTKKKTETTKKHTLALEDIEALMRKTLLAKEPLAKDVLLKEIVAVFDQAGIPKHGLRAKYEKILEGPRFQQSADGQVSLKK